MQPSSPPSVVTLYGQEGCHLCDEARQAILGMRGEPASFELREVDIASDDALLAAYLERIPVVEVDGRIVSELEFDPGSLLALVGDGSGPIPPGERATGRLGA